jgi:hypothetical protein
MTHGEEPIDRIRKAHSLVAKAAESWNAGSLAAVGECLATLEESAAELQAAEATMGRPDTQARHDDSRPGFRDEILEMKKRVTRIESLSDLAAAFLRRGRQSAGDSPMYRAGGFEDTDYSLAATTRIQA